MDAQDTEVYKHIANFIKSLSECYGDEFINVKLYNRLLEKTTYEHKESISKHIYLFKEFCTKNENKIVRKDYNFIEEEIRYSEKVFLNMKEIFEKSEDKNVLWKHVYTIASYLNGNIDAKKMLSEDTSENNFLLDIMEKVEGSIDPESKNPMDAITNMMTSGVFSELVGTMTSGLQKGDLNLGSLMGTMNNMMGDMGSGLPQQKNNRKKKRNNKKKKPKRK